jgi:hypothetical protein
MIFWPLKRIADVLHLACRVPLSNRFDGLRGKPGCASELSLDMLSNRISRLQFSSSQCRACSSVEMRLADQEKQQNVLDFSVIARKAHRVELFGV